MTYSLRQVQPLLTKPELELFQASRADAIKELNPRQLAAKLTRARALRDKYRDTYRRQTVATRTGPAKDRKQMGGENNRTEVKAEIMQEVLTRFEAQHAKAQAKLDKQAARKTKTARAHNAPGAPTTRTNPKAAQRSRRSTGNAAPGEGAQLAMRGATTTKPRQVARKKRAAEDLGYEVVSARRQVHPRRRLVGAPSGQESRSQESRTEENHRQESTRQEDRGQESHHRRRQAG